VCASTAELSLRLLIQPILQCVVIVLQCAVIVLQCVVIVLQCVVIVLQCKRHAHLEESHRPLQQQPELQCVVAYCAVL